MAFAVPADAYGRFMGRFSEPLAARFVDDLGLTRPQRALDVGCGPGALTAVLADRLGPDAVSAADPSASFVDAVRARLPRVDARQATAEDLPFGDAAFDAVLAQLVVHFMADPVAGLREMARVTRPGGTVAATVWDYGGGRSPLETFWTAVRELDPETTIESELAGARKGHLGELFRLAGLDRVVEEELDVVARYRGFEEWWSPYLLGVGPAGDYVAGLDDARRRRLRERCRALLSEEPIEVHAWAWCAVGVAG